MLSLSNSKTILVTGGAGYIGSATVFYLLQKGYKVIVIDHRLPQSSFFRDTCILYYSAILNSTINLADLACNNNVLFIVSDYADEHVLAAIFSQCSIDAVIHFAASIEVGLSVRNPSIFYSNNVVKTIKLLDSMRMYGVYKFIFSSSCAVYGIPQGQLSEDHPKVPISPYGKTKLMVEMVAQDYAYAYDIQAVCLRYFNAAGALPDYTIGERHNPETHLIPLLFDAAYSHKSFSLFGDNYATPDGTCIRDYLHIQDLAHAHFLALSSLDKAGTPFDTFNLGTGLGYSVKEVLDVTQEITGLTINYSIEPKRPADPEKLVAHIDKAHQKLGWYAFHSSLDHIISSAHQFYRNSHLT
jgi:UDP-glucose 4-epimerase